jgi:hypothetical protein
MLDQKAMKLQIIIKDESGGCLRSVPVEINSPDLDSLTKDRLWDVYQKMLEAMEGSKKP